MAAFFSQAPELDPEAENSGGVRAIGYQLVRYGLTGSETSKPRYQLFRSDVTAKETFEAGYDLDPIDGGYGAAAPDGIRVPKNIITPIFNDSIGPSTDFSLAANVIDFGIRAYLIDENDEGTGHLRQIFPGVNDSSSGSSSGYELLSTSDPSPSSIGNPHAFPEVIDVMVRILTTEGASVISAFEEGLIPVPDGLFRRRVLVGISRRQFRGIRPKDKGSSVRDLNNRRIPAQINPFCLRYFRGVMPICLRKC